MSNYKLQHGDVINAPGAPAWYRYGESVPCPKCGHKTFIYRPRKKLWVCVYESVDLQRCLHEASVYLPASSYGYYRKSMHDLPGDGDACLDVVQGLGLDDLTSQDVGEICGDNTGGGRVRGSFGGRQSRAMSPAAMEAYRRKFVRR